MPEKTSIEGAYTFRGVEYVVNMQVKADSMLTVVVEDRLTANQWKGSFDSSYIEDMTHKTGNYKQFHVFINMLESAISQTSDSVTMDLLTFGDLELLRKRKAGVGTQSIPGANNSSLTQKRYLILTYAVEFDKIHYPLPLPYAGKPDPELLQETIRKLQTELRSLKSQEAKDYRVRELEKLKLDYDQLQAEKEAVEREYIMYRKELKHTSAGVSTKEIRILRGVVKNLEEELMKEKAKHQRLMTKRRKENQDLLEEVQELRTSERTLKVRLKSLTNELAVYKRKAVNAEHSRPASRKSRPNSSRGSTGASSFHRERSLSRERGRSLSADRPRSVERRTSSRYENPNSRLTSPLDQGPSPYDRRTFPYDRRPSPYNKRPDSRFGRTPSPGQQAIRPSPAGTRRPRFDPTAYITEKKKQQQVSRARSSPGLYGSGGRSIPLSGRTKGVRSSPNLIGGRESANFYGRGRSRERSGRESRARHSSAESLGSVGSARRSRNNSYSDGNASDNSQRGSQRGSLRGSNGRNSRHSRNIAWDGDSSTENRYGKKSAPNTSTPNERRFRSKENIPTDSASDYLNRSADIDDIDARLQRIQEMMKVGL